MKNKKYSFPWVGENCCGTVVMFLNHTSGVLLYIEDGTLRNMENKMIYNVPIEQYERFEGTITLNF